MPSDPKRRRFVLVLLLSSILASAVPNSRFAGTWSGQTKIPSVLLTLTDQSEGLSGTITLFSLNGQKQESPISKASVEGNTVRFSNPSMDFTLTLTGDDRAVLRGRARELDIEFRMIREKH